MSTAAIVGVVAAVLFLAVLVLAGVMMLRRYRRRLQKRPAVVREEATSGPTEGGFPVMVMTLFKRSRLWSWLCLPDWLCFYKKTKVSHTNPKP